MLDARLDGAYRSRHGVGPGKCGARRFFSEIQNEALFRWDRRFLDKIL